jgi:N-acetylglucosaminyl-diphospho-decaprenol L-rhamnosyltransferase
MRVSILHWNRPAECLATIANLRSSGLALEITVVDNQSAPENLARLEADLTPDVDVIKLPMNVGWGPAHNVVLRRWLETETSEFCVISAHDALPQGDCLVQLVKGLQEHADWGMVCPEYGEAMVPCYSALRGATLQAVPPRPPGTGEEVEFCHGTLAILRRGCLEKIGLYDEGYFAYGDEAEIGIRAWRQGWKVGLVWGAVLVNPGSWSGGPVIAYLWTRNSLRLARTFAGVFGMVGRLAVVLLATLREKVRGAENSSMSSPKARLFAVRDYFRGFRGGPPAEVLSLR